MKYLDFEKHIKKELDGSKETVQMDALLASLNLGKPPKKSGFGFWMIIPFLLVALSVLAWKYMDSAPQDLKTPYLVEEGISSQELINTTELNSNNIEINSNQSNTNSEIIPSSTVENKNLETRIESTSELTKSQESTKRNEENPTKNKSINKSINNPAISINEKTPATNFNPFIESQDASQSVTEKEVKTDRLNSSYLMKEESSASITTDRTSASTSLNTLKSSRSELSIANLNKSFETLGDNDVDGKLFSRMRINCPSFDDAGWHLALVPEVGLFYPIKTLESDVLEEEMTGYFERLDSESTLEGIELGLHGMLVRDNVPLYLKVGISYSRIAERMNLKYEYIERETVRGIISETYYENGDSTSYTWGPIELETLNKGSHAKHHYIHMFDIPVTIGYSTYIAGLDVGIEAGINVNFMTRATGNLLTSSTEYTNLSLNRLFKNRIGLSYFGGLMIGRNFGRYGDIFVAPRFTYFPNEFNNELNNVSQRYLSVGLNAGVIYKID